PGGSRGRATFPPPGGRPTRRCSSPAWKTASPVEPLCARSSKMETSTHRTMMPCRTSPGPATQTTL
ncbi:50S ribosomal protein L32, partial [Dysosmobacter welbionis]